MDCDPSLVWFHRKGLGTKLTLACCAPCVSDSFFLQSTIAQAVIKVLTSKPSRIAQTMHRPCTDWELVSEPDPRTRSEGLVPRLTGNEKIAVRARYALQGQSSLMFLFLPLDKHGNVCEGCDSFTGSVRVVETDGCASTGVGIRGEHSVCTKG